MIGNPKPQTYKSQALRDMAKGRKPLLLAPWENWGDPATTVFCHANWLWAGKGLGKKCYDFIGVFGTSEANMWLDQGSRAQKNERQQAFLNIYPDQLQAWEVIARDPLEPQRFRQEAREALNHAAIRIRGKTELLEPYQPLIIFAKEYDYV